MNRARLGGAIKLAVAQLRYYRVRTILCAIGVAVAVLATITLIALGTSVLEAGPTALESIGGEVWVTPTSLSFAPGAVGGLDTTLENTHERTSAIEQRENVAAARGLHFQTVYVGTQQGDYQTLVGTGITGDGRPFDIDAGETFSSGDIHYANGSYDGPRTNEVLIDPQTANQLGVSVGDKIHVGGTIVAADENTFTVVGITDDISGYIGSPTVLLHLAELQAVTASTRTDPGSAIVVAIEDDVTSEAVRDSLTETYPELTVRTTDEQFAAVLGDQAGVIAGASAILLFAVTGGIAVVANVFGMLVFQQRRQLAALQATGVTGRTLLTGVVIQGANVGLLGGLLATTLAVPTVISVNWIVESATGFENLITLPGWAIGSGLALAVGVGTMGALIAGWLVLRVPTLENLDR